MKAFLLAAGFGVRLRPLSLELPKPVWPFFEIPLAAHVLRRLAAAGVDEVVVNLHHLPGRLRESLAPWVPTGVKVDWALEERILGTGGALLPWRGFLSGAPFFLVNADTYQEMDLAEMARSHRERAALATLAVRLVPHGAHAPLEVGPDGRIVRFLDARAPGAGRGVACEFAGVHVLDPGVLDRLPTEPHCINADVHRRLVAGGEALFGFLPAEKTFWSDLGTPGRYLRAHREILLGRAQLPVVPGWVCATDEAAEGGGRILAPSYVGRGARVERGAVAGPFAVLGSRSRVVEGARVADSVLWPDAVVTDRELRGAVLSPTGGRVIDSGGPHGPAR